MTVKLGGSPINKIYLGSTDLKRAYIGSTLIHETVAAPAGGYSLLDEIAGLDVCMQVDATKTLSYAGSGQTLANLIAAPSDGAAQADYDFSFGKNTSASTDDPTFVGTVDDPAAYFDFDGGDFFKGKSTPYLAAKAHRTDYTGGTWVAVAFRTPASPSGVDTYLATGNAITKGFKFEMNTAEKLILTGQGDSGGGVRLNSSTVLAGNTDYLAIIAFDASGSGTTARLYLNSDTPVDTSSSTWTSCVNDSLGPVAIGAKPDGKNDVEAGTRIYGAAMGQGFISDAMAADIRASYNDNHAQTY